jgi:hypothetical protein
MLPSAFSSRNAISGVTAARPAITLCSWWREMPSPFALDDRQPKLVEVRLDQAARMARILHHWYSPPVLVIIDNINIEGLAVRENGK